VHADPDFRTTHETFLPAAPRRRKGEVTPERALAEAKLNDADTIEDAAAWLNAKERMVLLHDRALIDLLARLPTPQQEMPREEIAAAE
jgi:membrane glycosyltransferase